MILEMDVALYRELQCIAAIESCSIGTMLKQGVVILQKTRDSGKHLGIVSDASNLDIEFTGIFNA